MGYIFYIKNKPAIKVTSINGKAYNKIDYFQIGDKVAERKYKIIVPTVSFGILSVDNDVTIEDAHICYDHSAEVEDHVWNV